MNKYYFLFIFSLVILTNTSFAQRIGYIITQKNDTIYCDKVEFVGLNFNYKINFNFKYKINYKYRVKRNDDFKDIDITNIKEFQLTSDSSIYIAKLLPDNDKTEFVQWLERGRVNVYQHWLPPINGGQSDIIWYFSKDNGPLVPLITNRLSLPMSRKDRKKAFINLLSEQPDLVTWYEADDFFEFDNLRDYIHRYNGAEAKLGYK
jgi:hypothetical protein